MTQKARTLDTPATPSPPVLRSQSMRALDRMLRAVAPKDVVVTLVGESGTGKEVLARRVHDLSPRKAGPFVPINCAAIPEALFESELFGHERGAFTGASERARGKIEAAERGTLFLDEVGELPMQLQAKLLRFIENRRFMRVGGSTKIQADVRLVFATLRPLEDEVRAGRFRADLYYRIQGITIRVPPLREHREDIAPLVERFSAELSDFHHVPPPHIGRAARAALVLHSWPGNVRELRNVIETLCLLFPGKHVRVRDLPEAVRPHEPRARPAAHTLAIDLDASLEKNVERIVAATLALESGRRVHAAERLGVSVRTVQRYLARGVADASLATEAQRKPKKKKSLGRVRRRNPHRRTP
jgi:DNA-binding NtrC family response regulator